MTIDLLGRAFPAPAALAVAALGLALGLAPGAAAVPAAVPAETSYQGSLFDDTGAARTGVVDLTVRIHDAAFGGTLLYKQEFPGTPLTDGVFTVVLGPMGAATDTPSDPLTTSFAAVFEGDLVATGPDRFLQLSVGSEGPLGRSQILAAPFAVRTRSADAADAALTAQTADVATTTLQLGPYPVAAFTEFYENTNLDNSGPNNADPAEGLADPDNDGLANFLDPDNDDDGLDDTTEVANGTDLNLVTPSITSFSPSEGLEGVTTEVTINGTNFEAGMSVAFGSENPAPGNLTASSFDVTISPPPVGTQAVSVTLANGQPAGASFETIAFRPRFGASNTNAQFQLRVTDPNQSLVTDWAGYWVDRLGDEDLEFTSLTALGNVAVTWGPGGVLHGLRCRDTGDCEVELLRDDNGDRLLGGSDLVTVVETIPSGQVLAPALAFDSAGRAVVAYNGGARGTALKAPRLARDLDGDGDFDGPGELQTFAVAPTAFINLSLALDASDRVAFAYHVVPEGVVRIHHDRNGDGDFDDTIGGNPETFEQPMPAAPNGIGLAFDPSDRLALVTSRNGVSTVLRRDLNADGDFGDAGETEDLATDGGSYCDATGGAGRPLAVVYQNAGTVLVVEDLDDDGSFLGPGEATAIGPFPTNARLAVTHDSDLDLWVAVGPLTGGSSAGVVIPNL